MSEPNSPSATRPPWAPVDLEALLGGRVLQAVGLISLFLSAAFFFKLAVDHNWISTLARVVIGLVAGSAMLAGGVIIQRRPNGNRAIVEGVIALGAALCYLSLWAAGPLFGLVSPAVAFAGMAAVTCVLTLVASMHRSLLTALYGVIGGLVTPSLLPHDHHQQIILGGYLLALSAAMLKLAHDDERFRFVPAVAFAGSFVYTPEFAPAGDWSSYESAAFATLFFLEFGLARFIGLSRNVAMAPLDLVLGTCNVIAFAITLSSDLAGQQQLLAAVLGAASVILAAAALSGRGDTAGRRFYICAAASILALAIPSEFVDRGWMMGAAYAVEGVALYITGMYTRWGWLRFAGVLVTIVMVPAGIISMALQPASEGVWTDRIDLFGLIAMALYVVAKLARDRNDLIANKNEEHISGTALSCANLVTAIGIANVISMLPPSAGFTQSLEELLVSVGWTLFAAAIFALAVRRHSAILRWQSLALFALTSVKVVTVDLAQIELIDRVGVCFGLGVATLLVSAFYLRQAQTAERKETGAV